MISTFSKGFRFLLCVIDIYGKYAWVISLKDKKVITITNAFQKMLKESNRKPNIWIDKGSEFYDRSMKPWLEKNDGFNAMDSTHSEGKYVTAERLIRTLKNEIYECTTSVSKNVYM